MSIVSLLRAALTIGVCVRVRVRVRVCVCVSVCLSHLIYFGDRVPPIEARRVLHFAAYSGDALCLQQRTSVFFLYKVTDGDDWGFPFFYVYFCFSDIYLLLRCSPLSIFYRKEGSAVFFLVENEIFNNNDDVELGQSRNFSAFYRFDLQLHYDEEIRKK